MNGKPYTKRGFARIISAFLYSINGLCFAFKNEASFRQEIFFFAVLSVILFLLPLSIAFKCLLFVAHTIVLIVELINSSIESIVDMTSPEYHVLAKHAKDLGSAAVLISLILAIVLWASAIYFIFHGGNT
ncbi:MAG: diacylglycerol kinase [Nitrospiraceae bacterium]|nr:MAG: diacylglycerol kinase [Nitrospiraceae bacterium]